MSRFETMSVSKAIFLNAVPAIMAMLLSVSQMVVNGMMAGYGDMAVAGYGVAAKGR